MGVAADLFVARRDLCDKADARLGADGLSPELVLRAAIVKQMHGFSYEQLAFHLLDSNSFRSFVRLPLGWPQFGLAKGLYVFSV